MILSLVAALASAQAGTGSSGPPANAFIIVPGAVWTRAAEHLPEMGRTRSSLLTYDYQGPQRTASAALGDTEVVCELLPGEGLRATVKDITALPPDRSTSTFCVFEDGQTEIRLIVLGESQATRSPDGTYVFQVGDEPCSVLAWVPEELGDQTRATDRDGFYCESRASLEGGAWVRICGQPRRGFEQRPSCALQGADGSEVRLRAEIASD